MAKRKCVSIRPHPDKTGISIISVEGREFEVYRHFGDQVDEVVNSAHYDSGIIVCTRKRDFGGCGKDAFKPECNVSFMAWLSEIYAKEVGVHGIYVLSEEAIKIRDHWSDCGFVSFG